MKPLVIEPMLNCELVDSGVPLRGEYAFSITTVPFLATSTTPANPLSRCASTIASNRAAVSCADALEAPISNAAASATAPVKLR